MAIFIVIVGISFLIFIHELGHFLAAKKMGLLVEEFGFGFPPKLFSKKVGETTYSINWLPFGGFVRIYGEDQDDANPAVPAGRSFSGLKAWRRSLIIVAGVLMNFIFGWWLMSLMFMIGVPETLFISEVLPDSPAAAVGLMPQDRISGFKTAEEFIEFIDANRGREVTLDIRRGSDDLVFKAVPRADADAALGVALMEGGVARHSFFSGIWEGLKTSVSIVIGIAQGFWDLLWGIFAGGRIAADIVGPVGVFGVASQAGELGLMYVVQLIALISLNLAVLNILPFPALDGGRFLFIILEKIKGSPLNMKFERAANAFGFSLLLLLMLAITVRDVIRLF